MKTLLSDLIILGGITCMGWGMWLIYPPLMWLIVGLMAVYFGVAMSRNQRTK